MLDVDPNERAKPEEILNEPYLKSNSNSAPAS